MHPKFFYSSFNDDLEQEVEVVRGSFMLIKREIFEKLGFAFDPRYFILFEDIDLCHEVKRLGYKVVYTPQITCIDYFGQSFSKQTKAWKYLQVAKSFKIYVRKWHSPLHLIWINAVIVLGFTAATATLPVVALCVAGSLAVLVLYLASPDLIRRFRHRPKVTRMPVA